jgi:hypothetical protein
MFTAGHKALKFVCATVQDKSEAGVFLGRNGTPGNDNGRAIVPAHCVNRKYDRKAKVPAAIGLNVLFGRHGGVACLFVPQGRLGRVFFQVDLFGHRDNLVVGIVTAGGANVVGAFQLTAIGAFVGVRGGQAIMAATIVAARFRHFILLHSH